MESDSTQRANDATLSEAHVVRILLIEDRADWGGGLVLRKDGIYRRDLVDDGLRTLTPREFATVVGSSGRGHQLLRLPCTIDGLEAFVRAEGLLDPFIARRLHLLRAIARRRAAGAVHAAGTAQSPAQNATNEQRQADRYAICINAGLTMPTDDYAHLPRGIGEVARSLGITRQALSEDLKAHIRRLNGR